MKARLQLKTKLTIFLFLLISKAQGQALPDYSNIPARELNCFRNFQETNNAGSAMNVYLLSYISTMTYPERLKRATGGTYSNTDNTRFRRDFRIKFEPWFWDGTDNANKPVITYAFLDPNNANHRDVMRDGIDPEVALISTPNYIIVSWRGTDRVWNPDNDFFEWIGTDFRAPLVASPGLYVGKVHGYFWHSVNNIKDQVDRFIDENGGANKQIWVIGHSLGAGQAQIYTSELEGEYQDLVRVRNWSGIVPPANPIPYDTYLNEDKRGGKITPRRNILVSEESMGFNDLRIKPLHEPSFIIINWRLTSRDYKTEGQLKINFTPEIIREHDTVLV